MILLLGINCRPSARRLQHWVGEDVEPKYVETVLWCEGDLLAGLQHMQKCKNFNWMSVFLKKGSWDYFGVLIYQVARTGLSRIINIKINKSLATVRKFPPLHSSRKQGGKLLRKFTATSTQKLSSVIGRIQNENKRKETVENKKREQRERFAMCCSWSGLLITRL